MTTTAAFITYSSYLPLQSVCFAFWTLLLKQEHFKSFLKSSSQMMSSHSFYSYNYPRTIPHTKLASKTPRGESSRLPFKLDHLIRILARAGSLRFFPLLNNQLTHARSCSRLRMGRSVSLVPWILGQGQSKHWIENDVPSLGLGDSFTWSQNACLINRQKRPLLAFSPQSRIWVPFEIHGIVGRRTAVSRKLQGQGRIYRIPLMIVLWRLFLPRHTQTFYRAH